MKNTETEIQPASLRYEGRSVLILN